ncbi:MAG: bifunctional N-acetylglucosamine-1-phosphate uridyltransferase/glucosamine-1-phosphate acetyltransferase [Rhodospirillaceae bacterium]|nr:bifunctional N-acetylglucosamine-1-phosphate uridyltransferase/glucosamine-1-phosphate acetyltransferase [Rhodospirillaceae bacterium]|tara:strand:- start:216 stop:1541 length:1326 start_codon:yes stop_codon:yes gene_type:complete
MLTRNLEVIILAAGLGTRMNSKKPKVLHEVAGKPIINYLIKTVEKLNPKQITFVIGPNDQLTKKLVEPYPSVIQKNREGTAHAVMAAKERMGVEEGVVLILFGADPFVEVGTLQKMIDSINSGSNVVVLGFETKKPGKYGRLKLNKKGELISIVEYKDASEKELMINLCNGGSMAVDASILWSLLDKVDNNNSKKEYYLTDIVRIAKHKDFKCSVIKASEGELMGIDSKYDLSVAERVIQKKIRKNFLDKGVTLIDPETVYFSDDIIIGKDVVIEPNVFFGKGVIIGDNCYIKAFSYIENAEIKNDVTIGPFARIRPGSQIGSGSHIGNFVEIKNSNVSENAKVNHLAYIGDSSIGKESNIGAGTITANFDGIKKSKTFIGEKVSIGSNSVLVAPVNIGNGAVVAAGSVVRDNVPEHSLHVESKRSSDLIKDDWAKNRSNK